MIPIGKGREPHELLAYRKQRHASYRDMPGDVKAAVKRSLASEQGYLCAYCMSRLPDDGLGDPGNSDVTIEHWAPQRPSAGEAGCDPLDYRNMLAVCNGNKGEHRRDMTCDAAKGNEPITVNPLNEGTLAGIYYGSNGEIHSTDERVEKDLTGTLNLNCKAVSLPQRRQGALRAMQKQIDERYRGKSLPTARLQKMLDLYESEPGKKTPYVGILTYWLRKKLRR